MQKAHAKFHVSAFLIYRLPSIPSTTIIYLLTRLSSWFGIQGTALNWFRSYLSFRCFRVKCNNNLSSLHTCLCGAHQGSVLGPLLFVMYTTPLSTLISSMSFGLSKSHALGVSLTLWTFHSRTHALLTISHAFSVRMAYNALQLSFLL